MAVRTWANSLGIAAGAGLLAGAGQLGVVYGLGVVRWDRDFTSGAPWHAQLTWVSFAAMVAVVIGALAGAWQARRLRQQPSLALSTALAFAAALGSTVILPLVGRPAGAAHLAESGNPGLSAVLVAGVGLLVGIVAAVAVLSVPPVSGSVIATVLWVWTAGLISAGSTLSGGASWASADVGLLSARGGWLPLTLLGPAVLIALAVAAIARFGGSDLRAVALCGLAGPALVGLAYLIAGPGGGAQTTAYRYALFAICAGFAVSALVAVVRRPRPARRTVPAPTPATTEPEPEPEPEEQATTEPEPARDPGRSRLGAADYGWPEPEAEPVSTGPTTAPTAAEPAGTEAAAPPAPTRSSGRNRAAKPEPAKPEPAPAKEPDTTAEPAAAAAPTPVPPAAVAPTGRAARKTAARRKTAAAPAAPEPVAEAEAEAKPVSPAPPPVPAPEPEPPAKGRLGRRGRRDPEPKPAKPARASKAQAREEDHVDWVRSLGGDDGIRVGGTEQPRHSRGTEPTEDA